MGMNEIILRESLQARDRQAGNAEADREVFSDICGYAGIIDSAGKNRYRSLDGSPAVSIEAESVSGDFRIG